MYKKNIGTIIPNLKIDGKDAPYPVLNERAIRATSGIYFVIAMIAFFYTWYTRDFSVMKIVIIFFFIIFTIKVLWGPKYSPVSIIGNFIVRKQKPEYVGAIQKRFA